MFKLKKKANSELTRIHQNAKKGDPANTRILYMPKIHI